MTTGAVPLFQGAMRGHSSPYPVRADLVDPNEVARIRQETLATENAAIVGRMLADDDPLLDMLGIRPVLVTVADTIKATVTK